MSRLAARLNGGANPKLGATDPSRSFYRYYAGFSENFVEDLLPLLTKDKSAVVLDPWNGTGTTTAVSARCGYQSIGIDRNPVLVAIATARGVSAKSADVYLRRLGERLRRSTPFEAATSKDPLSNWFGRKFVETFRGLQHEALGRGGVDRAEPIAANAFSAAHSIAHVVFFRVARRFAYPVFGSNPTWISRRPLERRISVPAAVLLHVVREEIEALRIHYSRFGNTSELAPQIILGDSTSLGSSLMGDAIGAIITSPPYGTRIDYAMAMAIELACLEPFAVFDFNALRRQLIGTTLTSHVETAVTPMWGPGALDFLGSVRAHRSKASAAYYSRYYENYFAALFQSLTSIHQIAGRGVSAAFVVQGSFYKEIYLDLASVTTEMLQGLGWQSSARVDREVMISFTLLNPASRHYPKSHRPVESVLVLRKR